MELFVCSASLKAGHFCQIFCLVNEENCCSYNPFYGPKSMPYLKNEWIFEVQIGSCWSCYLRRPALIIYYFVVHLISKIRWPSHRKRRRRQKSVFVCFVFSVDAKVFIRILFFGFRISSFERMDSKCVTVAIKSEVWSKWTCDHWTPTTSVIFARFCF